MGIFLIAFFEKSQSHIPLLVEFNLQIGLGAILLGLMSFVGVSNVTRIIVGFIFIALGMIVVAFFMPHRGTWMGQLMTNFAGPGIAFAGMIIMLKFGSDFEQRRR